MKTKLINHSSTAFQRLRRHWMIVVAFILAGMALSLGAPTWAASGPAERNQTIPAPTPTTEPKAPTPTSRPDDDDDTPPTPTPMPGQATQEPPAGALLSGVVVAQALNVRSGPGASFPVIGRLANNDRVEILFRDHSGAWWVVCCVQPGGQQGWVGASLIQPDFDPDQANQLIPIAPDLPSLPTPTPGGGELRATVNVDRLNMRSGPGADFDIVAKLEHNHALTVLARNERGDWWYVCCAADATTRGWVSAPYLTPAFDQATDLQRIPLFVSTPPTVSVTTTITASASTTPTVVAGAVTPTTTVLSAAMALNPPFVMQGERAQIVITVTNTTPVTASNVALRDELSPGLAFVKAVALVGDVGQETTDSGATVITFLWDEIAPSALMSATITVDISGDLPDGSVVDNLAAATADNAADLTAGMTIGMPPVAPPDFR